MTSIGNMPVTDAVSLRRTDLAMAQPSGARTIPSEGIEGDEWGAYVTLDTYDRDEHGIT